MAYTDQKMSGGKIGAIVIVALIHVALGYAFITGLASNFVKQATQKLDTFNVDEPPPPPPEDPPPPPPDQPNLPPPPTTVVTPPPIIQTPVPAPVMQTTTVIPPQQPTSPPAPPAPPSPPAPPAAPVISQQASSKGTPQSWYSTDDYPASALRAEAAGRVTVRVTVDANGRVSSCSVTGSSGNRDLDDTTCRVAQRRGRYTPAKDQSGNPIQSTSSYSVRWEVPKE
ncbi:energy transducer TonB [Sphingomonas aerophila]|uniref:Protein TonB n=1 Tax=Sphingomonas aerophila TaxID=1344948 RepID=A0A7W9ETD7_9SPHN|nr:energy transducer TonB [Sphingomonas aerophila]MBB5714079.1 protein TonB [Sphingomonas aerophila]